MNKTFTWLKSDIPGKRNSSWESLEAWSANLDSSGVAMLEAGRGVAWWGGGEGTELAGTKAEEPALREMPSELLSPVSPESSQQKLSSL